MPIDLATLPLAVTLAGFALAAAIVWRAGVRLARYADVVSERTGLRRAFVGLLLLAFATSLPEFATTASASGFGRPALATNNLLGGIVLQTVVLALADILTGRSSLTYLETRSSVLLQAALLIVLLALALAAVTVGEVSLAFGVGLWPVMLFATYLAALYLVHVHRNEGSWEPSGRPVESEVGEAAPGKQERAEHRDSNTMLAALVLVSGLAILVAGVALAQLADALATQLGLTASFVGATLLAASTSLPEVSTTVAAIRLGAPGLAIGNVFGSNMLMVAFLLVADLFYRDGLILDSVGPSERFALAAGIVVTAIYLIGLIRRSRATVLRVGRDSAIVAVAYAVTLLGLWALQ